MRTSDTGNSLPGSGKTILVLDDEPDVRKLITTTLTSDGYRVLTADNGESAIKAFKKSRQPVDLALLDVVSPGMSGPMVADRIAELEPKLPILFMSGYGDTIVVQRYVVDKGYALLPKPFTGEQLVKKVGEVLAARR
jgi:CheY-like chemotaxis protein